MRRLPLNASKDRAWRRRGWVVLCRWRWEQEECDFGKTVTIMNTRDNVASRVKRKAARRAEIAEIVKRRRETGNNLVDKYFANLLIEIITAMEMEVFYNMIHFL